jgi:hypothetical protein
MQKLSESGSVSGRRTLLYILSPSYSGSTLLTFLLSKHPEIATIGELKATGMGDVNEYKCSCGELIRECSFWRSVAHRSAEREIDFSVDAFDTKLVSNSRLANRFVDTTVRGGLFEYARSTALTLLPGARNALRESIRRNFEIGEVVCELQDKKVFLDSSKTPSRLRHLADADFWDIKLICLRRDGRGVANSNRKHLNIGIGPAAERWVRDDREIQCTMDLLGDLPRVEIRYEDLCQDPEKTLITITEAFGLTNLSLTTETLKDGEHHILGNNMRMNSVSEVRFDESWRTELSSSNLAEFSAVAGHVNAGLGYE